MRDLINYRPSLLQGGGGIHYEVRSSYKLVQLFLIRGKFVTRYHRAEILIKIFFTCMSEYVKVGVSACVCAFIEFLNWSNS